MRLAVCLLHCATSKLRAALRLAESAPLPATPALLGTERELLLTFRDGIANWAEVQAAWGLAGWADCTSAACAPVCTWGGVACEGTGYVTEL